MNALKTSAPILIIEDEPAVSRSISEILSLEGYSVRVVGDALTALDIIQSQNLSLILSDIKLPGMNGLELLHHLKQTHKEVPLLVMSGHGNIDTAVQALKLGAKDYLEKPLDLNRLLNAIRMHLRAPIQQADNTISGQADTPTMIGSSKQIQQLRERIYKVAQTDARVLITGPSGSGKELVARNIHALSARRSEAFIDVNCAAIPFDLIESNLFGHEKGAFTGAHRLHKGKFELADRGTLFLDEIADMHAHTQAKVLRALQEGQVQRIGSESTISAKPRVIAATNKDLKNEMALKTFRDDLYHRLAVVTIQVPALKDRSEDIPELCNYFLQQQSSKNHSFYLDPAAEDYLVRQEWPGNVRELANAMERLSVFCDSEIRLKDLKAYL